MASDAFFPMPDTVQEAIKAGVTAIIQPGGSIKDQLSIDECNEHGIAMVFDRNSSFQTLNKVKELIVISVSSFFFDLSRH